MATQKIRIVGVSDIFIEEGGSGPSQVELGSEPFTGTQDFIDVTFTSAFPSDQFVALLTVNMESNDIDSPPNVWVTLPTVNGFRIRTQSPFTGSVSWEASI